MSVRNPTTFNSFVNVLPMRTGQSIITTGPSQVVDDQMFILDKEELVACFCHVELAEAGTSFVDKYVFYLDTKDMCGEAGVSNNEITHSVYALVGASGGVGEVRLTSSAATANTTSTISVPDGTDVEWLAGDSMNIKTNGNEDTITVALRVTAAGTAYLYGIAIFADET